MMDLLYSGFQITSLKVRPKLMAFSITNFNQQAQDQQRLMLERMRGLCPQTANIGERLTLLPVLPDQVHVTENGQPAGPFVGGLSVSDHQMIGADMINAANAQALTAILGQACAREMEQGPAVLPPFLQNGRY